MTTTADPSSPLPDDPMPDTPMTDDLTTDDLTTDAAAPTGYAGPKLVRPLSPDTHAVAVGDLVDELVTGRFDDVAPEEPAPPRRTPLVTVFSPKGGTGVTFVATNLALVLADRGRNRVCLVDLRLQFGDLAISTGLLPSRTIEDAAMLDLPLADVVTPVVTPWRDGVDCILSPVDPAASERVSSELVRVLVAQLRSRYDYIVVDTVSMLTEHTLEVIDAADHLVLVSTPDVAAVKNLRILLDMLTLLGDDATRRSLVLNCADSGHCFTTDDVTAAIGMPVAVTLPTDDDVAESIDRGVVLGAERPDHPVVSLLRRFAAEVIVGEPARRPKPGWRLPWRRRG